MIDDWNRDLNLNEQPSGETMIRKRYTTTYTAKKEMLAIQEYYLKLEGEKLPTWKIIDHALEWLADEIGAKYGLDEED